MIVSFNYQGTDTDILCTEEELIKDIIQKFCNKIEKEKNSIYCIYSGNIIDENITLQKLKNSKKIGKKISILVNDNPGEGNNKANMQSATQLKKSSYIICPECKEMAIIKFKNYKISIKCKNNHIFKNKFLKDFDKTQMIDETKIICEICKQKNLNNAYNKEFFICLNCEKNLCPLCNYSHNKSHSIIKYEEKNFICREHEDNYSLYCNSCEQDLCSGCENEHKECETVTLGKLIPNKKDIDKEMKELKDNIDKFKDEIKKINDILEIFLENMNIYYNIRNDINNSFNIKLKNYAILNNMKEINNKDILKDFNEIINEKNISNKFQKIFKIYTTIITKDENNYFNDGIKQNLKSKPKSYFNINANREEMNQGKNTINNMNINSPGFMNNNFNPNMNMNNMKMNNMNNMNMNMNNMNMNNMNNMNMNNMNMMNNNNFMQNMQFPNMMMNNNYYPMNNMNNMMMNNNFMPNMNTFGISDEEWMKGFKMAVDDIYNKNEEDSGPKMKIIFRTTQGKETDLTVKTDLTIDELLKKYLKTVGRPELIKDKAKKICFLFNALQLKFGDNTSVGSYFKYVQNPKIVVNDVHNLIK